MGTSKETASLHKNKKQIVVFQGSQYVARVPNLLYITCTVAAILEHKGILGKMH